MDTDRRAAYEMLLAADEAVKDIYNALSAKGVLDRTVVIFMTDNGYLFGEHRIDNKSSGYPSTNEIVSKWTTRR
jgi:N-acetylglucosamine-6-sulfatase